MITISISENDARELLVLLKNDIEEFNLAGAAVRLHERLLAELQKGQPVSEPPPK